MKIYRDGKYFAEGDDLRVIAEVSGEDPGRYSFDLDELKLQKKSEVRARVVSECESLMPVYEMLYCVRARIVDPRLAALDIIAAKGRTLEARVNAAMTEAELTAVIW